jgi:phosphoglycerol transferase
MSIDLMLIPSKSDILRPASIPSRSSPFKNFLAALAVYNSAILLSLAILAFFLRPWAVSLKLPIAYDWGDGKLTLALFQGLIENGWYLHNDRLGAPFGLDMRGFPMADNLHFGIVRLLSLVWPDAGLLYNAYFILTFPLTTLSSLFVMRRFRLPYLPGLVASLLLTFLPYHFLCGYCGHLFLAAYYVTPLSVLVATWLYLGRIPAQKRAGHGGPAKIRIITWRSLGCFLICAVQASAGVYYAFFACFLFLTAGIAGSVRKSRFYPLIAAIVLIGITLLAGVLNVAPTVLQKLNGETPGQAVSRWPIHAEMGALKIAQLLLPVTNHRIGAIASLKAYYNSANALLVNANDFTTLGLVGSVGFIASFFALARRRAGTPSSRLISCLGFLNFAAVLLGTIGGVGSIFSTYVSPWIRSYYRISVFIAFGSLASIAVVLEELRLRYANTRRSVAIYVTGLLLLLSLGILDQTTSKFVSPPIQEPYADNAEFIQKIEATLTPGSRVFQLPYLAFPESLGAYGVSDYQPLWGYLHSKTLCWSYGAMRGSRGDLWQARVAAMPPELMANTLAYAGFDGLYIDRCGYLDRASALEAKFQSLLGVAPIVNQGSRLAFFDLREFTRGLRARTTQSDWQRREQESTHLVTFSWGNGFAGNLEGPANECWRWCTTRGEMFVINDSTETKRVEVAMCCKADNETAAHLRISGDLMSEQLTISSASQPFTRRVTVPPGRHKLTFETDARIIPGIDVRQIAWRIVNFSAQEVSD